MAILIPVRFFSEATPVLYSRDNETINDLLTNINLVNTDLSSLRSSFNTLNTDYTTVHKNQGGITGTHPLATELAAGFMSPQQVQKLRLIQDEAQVNALALAEALELVSRGITTLHRHRNSNAFQADPLPRPGGPGGFIDGYMASSQAWKLASVEPGAQVNNISNVNAGILTSGGNADALHIHTGVFPTAKTTPITAQVNNAQFFNFSGTGGLSVAVAANGSGANVVITPPPASGPGPAPPAFQLVGNSTAISLTATTGGGVTSSEVTVSGNGIYLAFFCGTAVTVTGGIRVTAQLLDHSNNVIGAAIDAAGNNEDVAITTLAISGNGAKVKLTTSSGSNVVNGYLGIVGVAVV